MPKKYPFKSSIHRRIMFFFSENQGSIDTPRGVSTWIDEDIQKVRLALEELAKKGFLKAHRTSSTVGYSFALTKKEATAILADLKAEKK